MVESQFDAGQQGAVASEALGEKAVVSPLAVSGIADDRVRDVFQVAIPVHPISLDSIQATLVQGGVVSARVVKARE